MREVDIIKRLSWRAPKGVLPAQGVKADSIAVGPGLVVIGRGSAFLRAGGI